MSTPVSPERDVLYQFAYVSQSKACFFDGDHNAFSMSDLTCEGPTAATIARLPQSL